MTAKLPNAALAALCTSVSWLPSKNNTGSSVSRPTSRTSFSVISAKASAADRCKSTLSLNASVVSDARGDPWKKFVVLRSGAQGQRRGASIRVELALTLEMMQQLRDGFTLRFKQERLVGVLSRRAAWKDNAFTG